MSNVIAAIIATTLGAGSPAPAPSPADAPAEAAPAPTPGPVGDDIVHLKSGGFVRGVVEEYEPGGQVVLRKADGSTRTFEAADVDRVEIGGAAQAPQPAAPPPTNFEDAAPLRASDEEAVGSHFARVYLVRVGDGKDIALQRRTESVYVSGYGGSASGMAWETACTQPCGRRIDTNGIYFVNGPDMGPIVGSKTINLHPYAGQSVTLEVEGGRPGLWAGGFVLVTAGATAAALSPLWFLVDDFSNATGGVLLAAGTGALVGGIVMMVRARHRVTAVAGKPNR